MRFWEIVYEPVRVVNQYLDVCLRGAIKKKTFLGTGLEIGINVELIIISGSISFGAVIDKNGFYNLYIAFGTSLGGVGSIVMPSVKSEIGFFPMVTVQSADDMHGWGTGHSLGVAMNFGPPPSGITVTFSLEAGFACKGPMDSLLAAVTNVIPLANELTGFANFIFEYLTRLALGTGFSGAWGEITHHLSEDAQTAVGPLGGDVTSDPEPRCNFENTGPKVQFGAGLSLSPLKPSYSSAGVWALGMNVVLNSEGRSPDFVKSMEALDRYFAKQFPELHAKQNKGNGLRNIEMPTKMGLEKCDKYSVWIKWEKWNSPEIPKANRVYNCDPDDPLSCQRIGIPFSTCTKVSKKVNRCKCNKDYISQTGQMCTPCGPESMTDVEKHFQVKYWGEQADSIGYVRDQNGKLIIDPQNGADARAKQFASSEIEAKKYLKARLHGQLDDASLESAEQRIQPLDEDSATIPILNLKQETEDDLEIFRAHHGFDQAEKGEIGMVGTRGKKVDADPHVKTLRTVQKLYGYDEAWYERQFHKYEERIRNSPADAPNPFVRPADYRVASSKNRFLEPSRGIIIAGLITLTLMFYLILIRKRAQKNSDTEPLLLTY